MPLEHLFVLSQIVASIALVASLIFVGRQVKENTIALQRGEHNSAMEQWTVVRQAIVSNREVAEVMTTGLSGERDLADKLRLEQILQEMAWASFHILDRTRRGIFPKGSFEQTGGALLCSATKTALGSEWWQCSKGVGFYPGFVADVDALLAKV
jgi:hypothetical protein